MLNDADTAELPSSPDDPPPLDPSSSATVGHGAVGRHLQQLRSLGLTDAVGLLLALMSLVAFAPPLIFDAWTPRMAVLLAVTPLGVMLLFHLSRQRDPSTLMLVGAVGWTVLISLFSGAPRSALVGFVGRDLSALVIITGAACWAVGRSMSAAGRRTLVDVVAWAGTLGVAVGVFQVLVDVRTGPLALFSSRPTGFYSNPVYYGGIAATILMIGAATWSPSRWRPVVVPVFVAGIGTTLSGSRVALVAALCGLAAFIVVRRSAIVLAPVGVAVGGLASGVLIDRIAGGGRNAASRLSDTTGGGRLEAWGYGVEAFLDRPLAGYGFGRFRPAVQDRFSAEFVRDHAPDDLTQAWFDAHNVGVGVLVAVGLVGALLFGAWAVAARPRVASPLAWGLVPMIVHWSLQPVSIVTLPLAALLLGAAGVVATRPPEPDRTHALALVIGLTFGVSLLAADIALKTAADRVDGSSAASVARLYAGDPVVSDVVAQVWAADPAGAQEVLAWRRRATEAEPDRPFWWTQLARTQLNLGSFDDAEASTARALDLQPTNARAWRTLAMIAIEREDRDALAGVLDDLCRVSPGDCGLTVEELIPSDES